MTRQTASFSWIAVAVAVGFAAPASAAPLDSGANYDPGSPSGKEYVIPLVGGRADGAGTKQLPPNAPVFGIGTRRLRGRSGQGGGAGSAASGKESGSGNPSGAGSAGASGKSAASGNGRHPATGRGGRARTSDRGSQRSRIGAAEAVGGTGGRTLLIVLAVLLPAALLAVLLQWRRSLSGGGRAA